MFGVKDGSAGEDGQALIELAVVIPVLLLIATGIGAFGIAMVNYLRLVDAVNEGARQMVIIRSQTSDPCATLSGVVTNAAPSLTAANLSFTFVLNGTTYTGKTCSAGAANLVQGASGKIAATYPCSIAVYKSSFAPGCTLQAATTELIQ
jgi:Flp pilus assembly protein TadG